MYGPAGSHPSGALPAYLSPRTGKREEEELLERERVRLHREENEDEELLLLAVASWGEDRW